MKRLNASACLGFALAALAFGAAPTALGQGAGDLILSQFATGTLGTQPDGCGGWYGPVLGAWDNSVDATAGGGGGALYLSCVFGPDNDTPSTEYVCLPGENPWWHQPTAINMSQYKSIQFDIMWDNLYSDLTIDQFNDPSTFPAGYLQPSASLSGSILGFDVLCAYGDGTTQFAWLTNFSVPSDASNGWVHVTLPYNRNASGIDGGSGILFKKWVNNYTGISGTHYANLWIDNVFLEIAVPPPPPTINPTLAPAVAGLNVFASTPGIYDRQSAELMATNGLSWVGHATEANPVTYSFTIADMPRDTATAYGIEAYLFMIPQLAANDNAPDWNEANAIIAMVSHNADGSGYMNFQYKVDEPGNNMMYTTQNNAGSNPYTNAPGSWDGVTPNYLETGNLGTLNSSTPIGTWTVKFTSDTSVTLMAPDGSTTNLVFPSYNASKFANDTNFVVYLGMQANNTAGLSKAIVYSNFSISGTPTNITENFVSQSVLDTNVWRTSVATGPSGVQIIPSGAAYWATWSLPDTGFALQDAASLTGTWTTLTNGPVIPLANARGQLISGSELPGGNAAFFRLIK